MSYIYFPAMIYNVSTITGAWNFPWHVLLFSCYALYCSMTETCLVRLVNSWCPIDVGEMIKYDEWYMYAVLSVFFCVCVVAILSALTGYMWSIFRYPIGFYDWHHGWGSLKYPFANFVSKAIFSISQKYMLYSSNHIHYSTGVTTAELRRHLSNVNVIFKNFIVRGHGVFRLSSLQSQKTIFGLTPCRT